MIEKIIIPDKEFDNLILLMNDEKLWRETIISFAHALKKAELLAGK